MFLDHGWYNLPRIARLGAAWVEARQRTRAERPRCATYRVRFSLRVGAGTGSLTNEKI